MTIFFLLLGGALGYCLHWAVMEWLDHKPEHARIAQVFAASHDAEGLLALASSDRLRVKAAGASYWERVGKFCFCESVNGFTVSTPERASLAELLLDLPKYQAQVEAIREVPR